MAEVLLALAIPGALVAGWVWLIASTTRPRQSLDQARADALARQLGDGR